MTTAAERPFEKCYLNIVGPLFKTQTGNKYNFTFQAGFSKYFIAVLTRQQDEETVGMEFLRHVILNHGTRVYCKLTWVQISL
jgi:diphthamide synthase (EF-2-diphthine--ammonia ligase)